MSLPRIRFTLRTLMVLVAILACELVVLIPVGQRLVWLYRSPTGSTPFVAEIGYGSIRSPVLEGEPVRLDCHYQIGCRPGVPAFLPYHVSIQVKLSNFPGPAVHDAHEETFYVVSGTESAGDRRGQIRCALKPPGPGSYSVRFEIFTTDLFGRTTMAACHTGGVDVKPPPGPATLPGP